PYGQAQRYSDPRLYHTDEEGIDAAGTWLATERSSFALHTLLQDASTLVSDLTSTGIFHVGQRRKDEDVDGTWAFRETERWTLQLGGTYSTSTYHGAGVTALSNYREAYGTATESFAYTERLSFTLNGSAGDDHTTGAEQSTRFRSLGAGFQWQPTERLSLQGSAGASRQTTGALTNTTTVGSLTLAYSSELSTFSLNAQRLLEPSGYGIFTQVDQATLTATRQLAPRVSLGSELEVYRDTSAFHSPSISFTYADRTYSEGHLRLSWQQTETWTLALQLLYDRADSPRSFLLPAGLEAHGWQASLQSVWAPLGASASR
ncbi:MAG: outer membrane beta-barrel protein, partial [Steroidobacteraceae bacterium]